jgi:hypothetical protein
MDESKPLTAEQIAELNTLFRACFPTDADKYRHLVSVLNQERVDLAAETAALRDRLARVEEQPPVRYELVKENNDSADWDEGDFPPPYREWWMIYRYETVTKERRDFGKIYFSEESARAALAALATPTDGAAPPRRSGDGDATGGRE